VIHDTNPFAPDPNVCSQCNPPINVQMSNNFLQALLMGLVDYGNTQRGQIAELQEELDERGILSLIEDFDTWRKTTILSTSEEGLASGIMDDLLLLGEMITRERSSDD
jgi:hypothetical protein